MKTSTVFAGCCVLTCTVAHAQSSIVLWGQVDTGVTWVSNKNGAALIGLGSGIGAPTRWGLTGKEDLGGGYGALFAFESGFNIDTGNLIKSNTQFDREAYVGLSSPFGEIDLGRHSDLMGDIALKYSNAFWNRNLYTFHPANLDSLSNTYQIENSVTFKSKPLHGFSMGGMYGLAGNDAAGHTAGGYALYDQAPFSASVTYMTTKHRVLDMYPGFGYTWFLGQNLSATKTFTPGSVNNLGIGATWKFTPNLLINALFTSTAIKALDGEQTHFDNQDAGLLYHFSAADAVTADYTYSWRRTAGEHWNMISVGNLYNFSRRTQIQLTLTYIKASGAGAVAASFPNTVSSSSSQVIAHAGITHSF